MNNFFNGSLPLSFTFNAYSSYLLLQDIIHHQPLLTNPINIPSKPGRKYAFPTTMTSLFFLKVLSALFTNFSFEVPLTNLTKLLFGPFSKPFSFYRFLTSEHLSV